jgi:hypothetical protein
LASYDSVQLDARRAHLRSADSIRSFRENGSRLRTDRPIMVERGDIVFATQEEATGPIWLRELQTRPAPPPLPERGLFWPRVAAFLIACAIAAPLSYYFAVATSPLHKNSIKVATVLQPAARVVSGSPMQSAPETRASVAVPQSAPMQEGALSREPAYEQPDPPRSPPTTTGVAEGRRSSPPERASVSATTANSHDVQLLVDRGNHFLETGDLISARILFTRAANAGNATAAAAMGATYDPIVLADRGVRGVAADLDKARSWYERATEMGSPEGQRRLEMLANRRHAFGPLSR